MQYTHSNRLLGFDWYCNRFKHCAAHTKKGEISPSYIVDLHSASRIAGKFPQCKLLLQMRNPVDALHSLYVFGSAMYCLEESFEEFIEAHPDIVASYKYSRIIEVFKEYFPLEQFFFMKFDDILQQPKEIFFRLCNFLDISSVEVPSIFMKNINGSGVCRSKYIRNSLVHIKWILDTNTKIEKWYKRMGIDRLGLYCTQWNTKRGQKEEIKPETRKYLQDYYYQSNSDCARIIGMSLDDWNMQ